MSRLLENLNEAQREAVATTEGPLLVVAGAGSGKTKVLTRRLAHILCERLAEPYQLLAVTFTNKAAGEMNDRVASELGGTVGALSISTFHSFCARFLRREAEHLGYDSGFTIFDEDDSVTLAKNCIAELGLAGSQFKPKPQRRKISDAKNKMIGAEQFSKSASGYFETSTARIYELYQRRIRECNAMDFDDLLFNTVELLRNNEAIGEKYRNRFKYVMVDEYQDTNHVQYLLLKSLVGEHRNICVVGDEDQSIYGWRGADIRNILDFEKDFSGAKIIKLERNYRSTGTILKVASAVISNNMARKEKTLWTESGDGDKLVLMLVNSAEDEAAQVVSRIGTEQATTTLKNTVILYRTNAQSRPFEEQLRRANVPYQIVGGISFYQRREIKDLMAYLKLIVNPADDISFQRVVNYPLRGIGKKSIDDILTLAHRDNISSYQAALKAGEYAELRGKQKRLQPFVELIEKYREKRETVPIDILTQDLVADLKLIEALRSEDEIVGQTRIENIESFIEGAAAYARSNADARLDTYLAEISLFTDLDSYAEIEDKITLMTLHTAKGLEYETVFIVGLEEGLFPMGRALADPMELEEERRLFYVGVTRAKKKIFLSTAAIRHRFGEVVSMPSRFIAEIPDELLEKVNYRSGVHTEPTRAGAGRPPYTRPSRSASVPKGVHYEYETEDGVGEGRIVEHPTFGRGKIVAVEGFGESLRLDIMFSGVGLKKIMAKYAKLKIVG